MNVVGLFAGIGGFELGFAEAGFRTTMLCEVDPVARAVLADRFPGTEVAADVRELDRLPSGTDIVCAGFPCQDLSSVGAKAGIRGDRSSLVGEVFRLLEQSPVEWVVVENVRFMLHLGKGAAMQRITSEFERLGYRWAYRVVDSRAFVPQRRHRVFLVASQSHDPRRVLFADDVPAPRRERTIDRPLGFYWTEGTYATGLAADGVPPLKGGSTVGIPSPPAILLADGRVGTPDLRDAERLQGFPPDWTTAAEEVARPSLRWRLVGNAITVPVAAWLASRIASPGEKSLVSEPTPITGKWPDAGWSCGDDRFSANVGDHPTMTDTGGLESFLEYPLHPLSTRATRGFLKRARAGRMRYPDGFLERLEEHIRVMV